MSAALNEGLPAPGMDVAAQRVALVREETTKARLMASRAVLMLVLAGVFAVAFIAAGAYTVYQNMQQAEVARGWIDHSQLVLANLQTQSERVERIDFTLQIAVTAADHPRLRGAQMATSNLIADQQQLQELVQDNPGQVARAKDLSKSVVALAAAVEAFPTTKTVPDKELIEVRNHLAVITTEERTLLHDRTDSSKHTSYRSFLLASSYLGLSFLIIVALFAILVRQARERNAHDVQMNAARYDLQSTVERLTERAQESDLLISARDELQLCTTTSEAHECFVRHMGLLLPGTSGATLMINNSRRMVEICARWGGLSPLLDGFNPDACCGLRAGKARWRRAGKSELHCMHFAGKPPENYLCVPLAAHGETQGFVYVGCDTAEALEAAEERMSLLQQLVELASLSIASLNLRAKLEGQSIRDPLTGLFNRHFMEIALERELHRAGREGTSLAVLMLDVDHFKKLNDTFGHEAGDMVLREVAECFRDALREEDIICRYGGEEFIVIMPDTIEEAALRRAENIRNAMAEKKMRYRGELIPMTTVSIGVAMYPRSGREGQSLIQLADSALYRAKRGGRNQVMLEAAVV